MSEIITCKAVRNGTQVYDSIRFQKDNISIQEASYYGGVAPYMRYYFYPLGKYTLYQSDSLIDVNNIDHITGTNTQYRIINDPEGFPDRHMEIVVDKVRGK